MSLTARSIQTALSDALLNSVEIAAQCLEYFGTGHSVSAGGSGRQGNTEAPSFAVLVWSRTAGEDDPERVIEASILLTITDATFITKTEPMSIPGEVGEDPSEVDVELVTYGGPEKLETLLELAAAEILSLSSEIMISELSYNFEPLEYFPLFVGGIDFTVTYPVLIGGYEPELS